MTFRLAVLAVVAAILVAPAAAAADNARDPALHALFEREFQRGQEEAPEFATFLGNNAWNDRLHDKSPAAIARRKAHVLAVLAELERFDAKRLSPQDRLSLAMMQDDLRRRGAQNAFYGDLPFGSGFTDGWLQVSPAWGPHTALASLARATPFRNTLDYENYLKRLAAVPRVLAESRAVLEAGIQSGWVPPREAMLRVPAQLAIFSGDDVTGTPVYAPFKRFPATMRAAEQERLAEAAR